ncbi:hypothetical protein [Candidatus Poriferisodalis sp.]|uniref:hypothetical protein n=1 Tax=Candidatus Poriferisodalis sp. TaxID=3101277 RepID=UPI003B0177D2
MPVDIDFAGTGNAVEFVTLTEGRWVVESSVKGNEGELGIGAEFTVKLLDSDGGLCDFVALAMGAEANESSVIKVGDGLFDLFDCAPGELALEIDAVGDWVVTFTKR